MFSFTAATVVPSKRDIPSDFSPPRNLVFRQLSKLKLAVAEPA